MAQNDWFEDGQYNVLFVHGVFEDFLDYMENLGALRCREMSGFNRHAPDWRWLVLFELYVQTMRDVRRQESSAGEIAAWQNCEAALKAYITDKLTYGPENYHYGN